MMKKKKKKKKKPVSQNDYQNAKASKVFVEPAVTYPGTDSGSSFWCPLRIGDTPQPFLVILLILLSCATSERKKLSA